ncbi:hypothetical protein DL771_012416 [Monosporascus sp. 5C6A]|nr:hypothetical protein DL771_012416 [Monosporascus sp. 5C6A]
MSRWSRSPSSARAARQVPGERVFVADAGGRLLHAASIYRRVEAWLAALPALLHRSERLSPQTLRNGYTAALFDAGADPAEVGYALGLRDATSAWRLRAAYAEWQAAAHPDRQAVERRCPVQTGTLALSFLDTSHPMTETILLTGATGYIASHTWVELLDAGYQVIGLDNLCNSSSTVLSRIEQITAKTPKFVQGDVRDRRLLDDLFASSRISAVIHFAALKSVGESVQKPLAYYDNNMGGLVTLCAAMAHANVRQLVFSSSATVYGNPHTVPITESFPLSATNPYGQTKVMGEQVLRDLEISNAA